MESKKRLEILVGEDSRFKVPDLRELYTIH